MEPVDIWQDTSKQGYLWQEDLRISWQEQSRISLAANIGLGFSGAERSSHASVAYQASWASDPIFELPTIATQSQSTIFLTCLDVVVDSR